MSELRESKKYAIGTIHEIVSGKLEIIDRFLKDGEATLKYKMMDSGEVVENKEKNLASALYKARQKKKLQYMEGEISVEEAIGVSPELSHKILMDEITKLNSKMDMIIDLLKGRAS